MVIPVEGCTWLEGVPEWEHPLSHAEGVRNLVDESKPRANIGDGFWFRKIQNCLKELLAWPDTICCDLETSEFNSVLSKDELIGVEGDPIPAAYVQPVACLIEAFFHVVGPQEGVVDTLCLVWDVCDNLIQLFFKLLLFLMFGLFSH